MSADELDIIEEAINILERLGFTIEALPTIRHMLKNKHCYGVYVRNGRLYRDIARENKLNIESKGDN